ncbi:MAG: hypothetical protein RQ728_00380 [Brevefilum sp.]|nr:hypothetical protein [Brevefilum sp.]
MVVLRNFKPILRFAWRSLRLGVLLLLLVFFTAGSVLPPSGLESQAYAYTRHIEFDYGAWTLDAIAAKLSSWSLSLNRFLPGEAQSQLVLDTLSQVSLVNTLQTELVLIYANPNIENPHTASKVVQAELEKAQQKLSDLAPLAESILQSQLMSVVSEAGLGQFGQVFPPSLYQFSDTPQSLVISPREEISQVLDISLLPVLNADDMDALETRVLQELNHAALVVPIGGVGTYPTMVMQTADIIWLTEVIAHEWIHNYLTLRPLGINYYTTPELRTINETTASLVGKELGRLILQKYYPTYPPPEEEPDQNKAAPSTSALEMAPETFDFRAEMRETRVEVDRLLEQGQIEQAESYMETRRQVFLENGFLIRKLNQAYFAFYGAYNDVPGGGAAGEDPVGPAVQAFREKFTSLSDFLKTIAWVNSYADLLKLLSG